MPDMHRLKLCLATGLFGVASCQVAEPLVRSSQRPPAEWPSHIAGRARHVVADDYAVYAKDAAEADRINVWLEEELSVLRSAHKGALRGKGLVFAVGSGADLPPAVDEWRSQNVDRTRLIEWTSPIRSQSVSIATGRPYCLGNEPYFIESFEMAPDDAIRLGLVPAWATPAWVCFLTTDAHVTTAFDVALKRMKKEHAEWVSDNVPAEAYLLSFPAMVLMTISAELLAYPRFRSIDVDLMHLQRRETVRRALIRYTTTDICERRQTLAALQDEVDDAWKEMWFRRPLD